MSKEVICFDIDGVIAGGKYIPDWDRYPEHYLKLPLIDPSIPSIMTKLADIYNIYLVSTRRYKDALSTTREWLEKNKLDLKLFSGVIVGIPRLMKSPIIEALGAKLHVDDDLTIVKSILGGRGVLFWSGEWNYRPSDYTNVPVMYSWEELYKSLIHPMYTQLEFLFGGNNNENN